MSGRALVLAVDVGTSALKAALYDAGLTLRRSAAACYPIRRPRPGWVEADPRQWWRALLKALRALLTAEDARRVEAIAFSTLYPAVFPADGRLRPLRPALLYCDMRSAAEGAEFERRVGRRRLLERTGSAVHPGTPALASLVWLARHEPSLARRARWLLQPNSYLAARLTGRVAMDLSTASLTGILDLREKPRWWPDLFREAGWDPAVLPPLVGSADTVGGLTSEAARATGVRSGIPVVAGAGDTACAALAGGLIRPGPAVVSCGSSDTIAACTRRCLLPPGVINGLHAVPGLYLVLATVSSAGLALEWAAHLLWGKGADALEKALAAAGKVPPGAGGLLFLPYLQGERTPTWDADARGLFVGLSVHTDRESLMRSAVEGVALALRDNLETLENALGERLDPITLVGGGARSPLLDQVRADATGRPLQVAVRQDTGRRGEGGAPAADSLAGAAILGAVAAGLQPDFRSAVGALHRGTRRRVYRPRRRFMPTYEALFASYRALYPALRRSFRDLAALRRS